MDTSMSAPTYWRKCTTCKKLIGFNQKYWICSVSTCNRQRTGLVFCDLKCFDAHVPVLNHRDAGAFEKKAPSRQQFEQEKAMGTENKESRGASHSGVSSPERGSPEGGSEDEILVVASKV